MRWKLLIAFLAWLPVAMAQDLAKEDAAKVQRLVHQMGADEFKVRQEAAGALRERVEKDPEFAKYLRRFANDDDPEIRVRIAELIKVAPVVLQWMDPAEEKNVKSRPRSPKSLKLTIKNRSMDRIAIYWVDWDGRRVSRGELKPGQQRTIAKTYVDHYWLITNPRGEGLALYVPKEGKDAQIIHTGKEGK